MNSKINGKIDETNDEDINRKLASSKRGPKAMLKKAQIANFNPITIRKLIQMSPKTTDANRFFIDLKLKTWL